MTIEETNKTESASKNTYKYYHIDDVYYDVDNIENLNGFLIDKSIKKLSLINGTFSDITLLKEFTQLEDLAIEINDNLTDISSLSELKTLKRLSLSKCKNIKNLKAISSLVNLEYLLLNLEGLDKTNGAELLGLHKLEDLNFTTGNIISIDNIAQLVGLKRLLLDISNVNEGSISKLGNLIRLTQLDLLGVPYRNKVTDANRKPLKFDGFETLVNLEFLMFKGFNIDDVSILANLPKLIYIDFSQSVVNDYTPLLKNKSLSSIVVPFEWDMSGKDKDLYELFETHNISIGTLEYFR